MSNLHYSYQFKVSDLRSDLNYFLKYKRIIYLIKLFFVITWRDFCKFVDWFDVTNQMTPNSIISFIVVCWIYLKYQGFLI